MDDALYSQPVKGFRNSLARQIGESLVCAELGRQGLIGSPFAGNVPMFDVLAADERCRTLPIQVKATRSDNWPSSADRWMHIQYDPETRKQVYSGPVILVTPQLIWVCVAIASRGSRDRFFILTEADLQSVIVRGYTSWMESIGWQRPRSPESLRTGWNISDIEPFEDKWELIRGQLSKYGT
jgi:hypothetical protein